MLERAQRATSHDITDQQAAQDQLRRSQEACFDMVAQSPLGIYVVDAGFRLVIASQGARKVFAHVHPLLGRCFAEVVEQLWPAPFAQKILTQFRKTLETGDAYAANGTRETRADTGQEESYDWQLLRVLLPDGGYGVVCYFYDATHVTAVHDSLRQSQQRLQLALDASQLGTWDWEVSTQRVHWDERASRLFAFDGAQAPSFDFFESRIHPEDLQANRLVTARALEAGDYENEYRVCLPDGRTRQLLGRARVLRDGSSKAVRMIGVVQDVTDQRLAESQRRWQSDRDAFSVELDAALRSSDSPHSIKASACGVLCRAIGAQQACFGEFDASLAWLTVGDGWTEDAPGLSGRWRATDLAVLFHGLALGRQVVIDDVAALQGLSKVEAQRLASLKIRACAAFPLPQSGRCRSFLSVHGERARQWTEEHLWRIKATAEKAEAAAGRARAEQALLAAEQRYRTFITHSSEGIWRVEFDPPVDTHAELALQMEASFSHGRFAECNDQMARMYGLKDAGALLGGGMSLMRSRSLKRSDDFMAAFIRNGYRVQDVESQWRSEDGRTRWYLSNVQGVVMDGLLVRAWGTQREITQHKEQQAALHASEMRFRMLVATVTDVTWTSDAQGAFVAPQEAWQAYTGQGFELHRGHGWLQAIHVEDRGALWASWQDCLDSFKTWQGEGRLWHVARQEYRHVSVRATAWFNAAGEVVGWVGACSDVHEARRSADLLREADRRKDAFLATLAHELRNPLAPVRTAAALLQRPGLDLERTERARAIIDRQTRHMALLLDDLLDIARITQGRLILKKAPVMLNDVVDAAHEAARPLLELKKHDLRLQVPAADMVLHADFVRLTQVLTNLLTNAAHYTPEGGCIELRAQQQGSSLLLQVEDNGIGLSAKAVGHVFRMSSREDMRDTDSTAQVADGRKGLGIGLAIVKGLVELHGGEVSATSGGVGAGSRFSVRLPIGSELGAAAAQAEAALAPGEGRQGCGLGASQAPRRRVLVADDNEDAAEMLAALLEASGHTTRVVGDGLAALEAVGDFKPHVAILDIGMPGLDGYRLAQGLRETEAGKHLRLAALTGWGQAADRQRAHEAGFDIHFTKPVETSALLAWIDSSPLR